MTRRAAALAALRAARCALLALAELAQGAHDPHFCKRNHGPAWRAWGAPQLVTRCVRLCVRASRAVRRVSGAQPTD